MNHAVSIVKCNEYNDEDVYLAIKQSLAALGGLERIVKPGMRVLLKVNMLMASLPEDAVTTHPAVVKAVCRLVTEAGGKPVVGDSPGNALANVAKALERTQIKAAAEECGARVVSFEKAGLAEIDYPNGRLVKKLYISRAALDCDLIISLPKLKTHNYVLFTGAVKNMFGTITGFNKGNYHLEAPHPDDFCRLLVDVYEKVKPGLAIMDGIWGMEGHGPAGGQKRHVGLLLSSFDPVALDAVAGKIIGYEPSEIGTTRIAASRGLGEMDLEKIEIHGPPLNELLIKDFWRVSLSHDILKSIPRFIQPPLQYLTEKLIKISPQVVKDKCRSCAVCEENCAAKALSMVDGYPLIDYDSCIKCYCCHELCPEHAFTIKRSFLARLWGIGVQV